MRRYEDGMTPEVQYTILNPRAEKPTKAYPDDAGIDLASVEQVEIPIGGSVNIATGLAFAIPEGYWGLIQGRSSTWHRHRLMVMPAVIDAGWRGELFVAIHHPGVPLPDGYIEPALIHAGQRLGQLIILPAYASTLAYVDRLPDHPRGTNGFGSSGR
jgi:dUTP pyrophosphatase